MSKRELQALAEDAILRALHACARGEVQHAAICSSRGVDAFALKLCCLPDFSVDMYIAALRSLLHKCKIKLMAPASAHDIGQVYIDIRAPL